jgi:hypothetical protein
VPHFNLLAAIAFHVLRFPHELRLDHCEFCPRRRVVLLAPTRSLALVVQATFFKLLLHSHDHSCQFGNALLEETHRHRVGVGACIRLADRRRSAQHDSSIARLELTCCGVSGGSGSSAHLDDVRFMCRLLPLELAHFILLQSFLFRPQRILSGTLCVERFQRMNLSAHG